MTRASIVADAGPLIALSQIGQLAVLPQVFPVVLVPPEVAREIARSVPFEEWMEWRPLGRPLDRRVAEAGLDAGETEAIGLALESGTDDLLLDDRRARRFAARLGFQVTGTVGLLLLAKRRGLIEALRPELEALLRVRFFLGHDVIDEVLNLAGEDE